ncbi:MAG: D-hexose-6-phosphate mutarotase [Sulfurimonas sp.]
MYKILTKLKKLSNGFEYLEVKNSAATAKIALSGAHIFQYKRDNEEDMLWLSDISAFEEGIAIRGGIPICWPSFGKNNPMLPQHGFARTSLFSLLYSEEIDEHTTEVLLRLTDSKESRKLWNYKFELNLKIIVSKTLKIELQTINKDGQQFTLTQAFHSYFNISNIDDVSISGLNKKPYLDALDGKIKTQDGDIKFTSEYDAVYQKAGEEIVLKDKNRTVSIRTEGSDSAVVWNPWIKKCSQMSYMTKEAYKEFVCIESSNAFDDFITLKASQSHTLKATFTPL